MALETLFQLRPLGHAPGGSSAGVSEQMLRTETLRAVRVPSTVGLGAKYLTDGLEVTVEELVARDYIGKGWSARVTQAEPWLLARDFLFMRLTHARENFPTGGFRYLDLLFPQNFDRGTGFRYGGRAISHDEAAEVNIAFGIAAGGLLRIKPLSEIVAYAEELLRKGLPDALAEGFDVYCQSARIDFQIERANRDNFDRVRWLLDAVPDRALLAILVRTVCGDRDTDSGFPDVIAFTAGRTTFLEAKSPGDSVRDSQSRFHEIASQRLGIPVVICQVEETNVGTREYQDALAAHQRAATSARERSKGLKAELAKLLGLSVADIKRSLRLQYDGPAIPASLSGEDFMKAASLFEELGHWWNAQFVLAEGIRRTIGDPRLRLREALGAFWHQRGSRHKALHELLLVLAECPNSGRATGLVREVYATNGVPAEAERVLRLGKDELVALASRVAFVEYWSRIGGKPI